MTTNTTTLSRDDDINVYTSVYLLDKVHKPFLSTSRVHTVALLMKDLWENHALFYYLLVTPFLEVGLHGWEHKDYSVLSYDECYSDLKKSLEYWNENATRMLKTDRLPDGKEIKIFFAPWNREGENIRKACADLGLRFCNVGKGMWEEYWVKSFHWWSSVTL